MDDTLDFDPIPMCQLIHKTIGKQVFVLIIYDLETGDARQFSDGDPQSQLNLMRQAIEATEKFLADNPDGTTFEPIATKH
jgi:hypothetical protein